MAPFLLPADLLNLAAHPYFPLTQSFQGYAPPAVSLGFLLGTFAAGVVLLMTIAWCTTGEQCCQLTKAHDYVEEHAKLILSL